MRFILLVTTAGLVLGGDPLPPSLQPDNALPSPEADISLDAAPANRWDAVVEGVLSRHGYEHSFAHLFDAITPHLAALAPLCDFLEQISAARFPDLDAEVHGIAGALLGRGYQDATYRVLTVVQFLGAIAHLDLSELADPDTGAPLRHEDLFGSGGSGSGSATRNSRRLACTSLIGRNNGGGHANGTLVHARNDDADATHRLRNLTVDLTWRANGIVVARSTQFVGYVGTYTVMSIARGVGIASLTQDDRVPLRAYSVSDWMGLVRSSPTMVPTAHAMRGAMISGGELPSYGAILQRLQTCAQAASGYYVLAGLLPADGAIVERNFTTQRTLRLGEQGPTYAGGVALPWALVQTNWDWDKPEPAQDPRRATAGHLLSGMGQGEGATMDALLRVLSTEGHGPTNASAPNSTNGLLNVGTAFSVVMVPRNATLRSYLRASDGCCA
jgi:hypothetical protein